MRGYDATSYGDGFADVYDEWYETVTDVAATVELVGRLVPPDAGRGRVLELGVGTGRLAVPLAAAGHRVVGIDTSEAMLDRLRARPGGDAVETVRGDMVDDLPTGPFDVVLVAYNTIFNVLDASRQRLCFARVAERLVEGGALVVEAIVPDPDAPPGRSIGVRSIEVDRVVLSVADHRPDEQRTEGQFVELTETAGVRLRPWAIRWATPAELDEMAAEAGLVLADRRADAAGTPFDGDSDRHVSVYRREHR